MGGGVVDIDIVVDGQIVGWFGVIIYVDIQIYGWVVVQIYFDVFQGDVGVFLKLDVVVWVVGYFQIVYGDIVMSVIVYGYDQFFVICMNGIVMKIQCLIWLWVDIVDVVVIGVGIV